MRLKSILFVFIGITLLFAGCKKNNDISRDAALNGAWKLKNVSGGWSGINIDYNEDDVYWTFHLNLGKLVVINNIVTTGPEDIFVGFESGTYNYTVNQEVGADVLYINEIRQGVLYLSQETLMLDEGVAVDGIQKEFGR